MSWRRNHPFDAKSDYRVIDKHEVLDKNLYPCGDCGDPVGYRGKGRTWAGNLKRRDIRIYRGGQVFHYITRPIFLDPQPYQIQRGSIKVRCGRYILLPNRQLQFDARTFL